MPSPQELAMMQAIQGGGAEEPIAEESMNPTAGAEDPMSGVIALLQNLIEAGKIDPQTAEMILQALAGGSGME